MMEQRKSGIANYDKAVALVKSKFMNDCPRGLETNSMPMDSSSDVFAAEEFGFKRCGVRCTIMIDLGLFDGIEFADKLGNEWSESTPTVKVRWSSNGQDDLSDTLAHLAFYSDIAAYAAEIKAELPKKLQRITRTAEEARAAKSLLEDKALCDDIAVIVSNVVSPGFKMNRVTIFEAHVFDAVNERMKVEFMYRVAVPGSTKRFNVKKTSNMFVQITRVA